MVDGRQVYGRCMVGMEDEVIVKAQDVPVPEPDANTLFNTFHFHKDFGWMRHEQTLRWVLTSFACLSIAQKMGFVGSR